jgi:hypothetical protein
VIRLLLLFYPEPWRRRYGAELEQLVSDTGLSTRSAIDICRSGLAERRHVLADALNGGSTMVIGPAYRHPRGLALGAAAVLAPTFVFVVGSLLAYQLGVVALQPLMDEVNRWLAGKSVLDVVIVASPAIALLLALVPLVRVEMRPGAAGREAVIGIRLRTANVLVGVAALAIGAVLVWYFVFESVAS